MDIKTADANKKDKFYATNEAANRPLHGANHADSIPDIISIFCRPSAIRPGRSGFKRESCPYITTVTAICS